MRWRTPAAAVYSPAIPEYLMKKLQLNAEELAVESFETQDVEEQRGTVHGHTEYEWMCSHPVSCDYGCNTRNDGTCPTGATCQSCVATCQTCGTFCGPTYYAETCPPECYD
jgi:hypothetical protein